MPPVPPRSVTVLPLTSPEPSAAKMPPREVTRTSPVLDTISLTASPEPSGASRKMLSRAFTVRFPDASMVTGILSVTETSPSLLEKSPMSARERAFRSARRFVSSSSERRPVTVSPTSPTEPAFAALISTFLPRTFVARAVVVDEPSELMIVSAIE